MDIGEQIADKIKNLDNGLQTLQFDAGLLIFVTALSVLIQRQEKLRPTSA